MPCYEFFCHNCQEPFEIVLTFAEYEKGKITCPKCGGKRVYQEAAEFFAVTRRRVEGIWRRKPYMPFVRQKVPALAWDWRLPAFW